MTSHEIDVIATKYYRTHRRKYSDTLIKAFHPFIENKAFKLKKTVSDPAISSWDIYQDLVINFIHTLRAWNPKRKCAFKTFLMWHNVGNPVRAKRRGGINYLFKKGRNIYFITDYDSYSESIGEKDTESNHESGKPLVFYKVSR